MLKHLKLIVLVVLVFVFGTLIFSSTHQVYAQTERTEVMNAVLNPDVINYNLNPNTTETYHPNNRKFQRMSSIIQYGHRIYAAWTAGGDTEPHKDNYIVVAYSDDLGNTWTDPYLIIDLIDYQSGDKAQLPSFWINPDGLLFLFYSCNKTGYKTIISDNADANDIKDVNWTTPRVNNSGGAYTAPTTLKNGHVLMTTQGAHANEGPVYLSVNKGSSWTLFSTIQSTAGLHKRFNESQIVELSDGTLMYLARLENPEITGGLERAYSYDGGATWTDTEYNLPYPLRSAASRVSFKKLSNGNLILVTNDSNSSLRTNLTVFMSEDDGKTWPYKLLLDDRHPISYPDLSEGDDGSIVVIYDPGGNVGANPLGLCEIRVSRFFQTDIKNGKITEPTSYIRNIISKSDGGTEILSVETVFDKVHKFKTGATLSDVTKNLPSTIIVITDKEETVQLEGTWLSDSFDSTTPGVYSFSFRSSQWNTKELQDNYSLLKVSVVISDENKDSSLYIIVAGVVLLAVVASIITLYLKRKKII